VYIVADYFPGVKGFLKKLLVFYLPNSLGPWSFLKVESNFFELRRSFADRAVTEGYIPLLPIR